MKSINLQITDEINDVLTAYSKSIGISRTNCIRRAIVDYLLSKETQLKELQPENEIEEKSEKKRIEIRLLNKQARLLQKIADEKNLSFSQYTKEVLLQSIDNNILSKIDINHISQLILELQKTGRLLNQAIKNHAVIPSQQQEEIIKELEEKYAIVEFKYIDLKVRNKNKL